jgi:predicted phage terminase large subunit-like protein
MVDTMFQALVSGARDSLCAYSSLFDPKYKSNRFHDLLAKKLEEAVKRGRGRIIVQAPPQHGKSRMVSSDFPAWFMGKHPDAPIIAASYGKDLAERNGQSVRDRIGSAVHQVVFPDSALNASTTAKANFMMAQGGRYFGTTVQGGATGFSSKLFIIDDPVKNREEAESPVMREKIKDWYKSVVYTRLAEDSILVIMHTRWHQDDLAGWLLREQAHEGWEVINFPAIAEEDDILGRKPGEALVPDLFSVAALDSKRKAVGARDWLALYQQQPTEKGGGVFKRDNLRFYVTKDKQTMARPMNRYILIDPARTRKKTSDYTAMAVIGLHSDGNYYVLDMVYDKLTLKQRGERLFALHRKWKPMATGYKATGHEGDIDYMHQAMDAENYRFSILPVSDSTDKAGRIMRLSPEVEEHRWWLPESLQKTNYEGEVVDLIELFIESELEAFPAGIHDDMLDCLGGIHQIDTKWPKAQRIQSGAPKAQATFA